MGVWEEEKTRRGTEMKGQLKQREKRVDETVYKMKLGRQEAVGKRRRRRLGR